MRLADNWLKSPCLQRLKAFRSRLLNLHLPCFLNPINSFRQLVLWFLIYGGLAGIIYLLINLHIGVEPTTNFSAAINAGFWLGLVGAIEEVVFRGLGKIALGNTGLILGTIAWVILHQFYAPVTTPLRIPADTLLGIFYIKLWRGKYRWLSLVIHFLWNFLTGLGLWVVGLV